MPLNYRQLFIRAVEIIFHNRYLWFFGLFATLLTSGIYNGTTYNGGGLFIDLQTLRNTGIFDFNVITSVATLAQSDPVGLVIRVCMLLAVIAVSLFILWLAVLSQAALVFATGKLYGNKKPDFYEALQAGKSRWWGVFALNIIEKIVVGGIASLLLISWLTALRVSVSQWAIIAYTLITIVVAVAVFLVALGFRYAIFYRVLQELSLIDAFRAGFALLRSTPLASIEAGIAVMALNIVLGIFILFLLAAAAIPFFFLLLVLSKLALTAGAGLLLFVSIIFIIALTMITGGIFGALTEVLWTMIFIEMMQRRPMSTILYIINGPQSTRSGR